MRALLFHLWVLLQDRTVHVSGIVATLSMINIDIYIKIIFGLPGAVYICLKIYKEFIKKQSDASTTKRD